MTGSCLSTVRTFLLATTAINPFDKNAIHSYLCKGNILYINKVSFKQNQAYRLAQYIACMTFYWKTVGSKPIKHGQDFILQFSLVLSSTLFHQVHTIQFNN